MNKKFEPMNILIYDDKDIKAALAPKKGGRPKKVLEGGEKDGEKSSD